MFHNFDSSNAQRSFEVAYTPTGLPALWGEFNYGDGTLYGGSTQTTSVERGNTMGRAGTVQLLIEGQPGHLVGIQRTHLQVHPAEVSVTRPQLKTCKTCGEAKRRDEFDNHKLTRDKKQTSCKQCCREANKARYHALTQEQKDRRVAQIKARKYGMTLEEMAAYVDAHGDLCDVCGRPDTTHRKATWTHKLTFDHDHATGKFRGLICSTCNVTIGNARDDPAVLRHLADYIERNRAQPTITTIPEPPVADWEPPDPNGRIVEGPRYAAYSA